MNKKYLVPVSNNLEANSIQRNVGRNCLWKEVSIVSYNLPLLSKLSISENLMLPLNYIKHMSIKKSERIVFDLLEKFGLEHTLHHRQKRLNDYETLIIKYLRAIMLFPKHIIFIMPNNMIQLESYEEFIHFINTINDFTVTIVEHKNFSSYYTDTDYMEINKKQWQTHVLGI